MKTERIKAKTIDEYIAAFPREVQEVLQQMRNTGHGSIGVEDGPRRFTG